MDLESPSRDVIPHEETPMAGSRDEMRQLMDISEIRSTMLGNNGKPSFEKIPRFENERNDKLDVFLGEFKNRTEQTSKKERSLQLWMASEELEGHPNATRIQFSFHTSKYTNRDDLYRWYIFLNSGGTPRTPEELKKAADTLNSSKNSQL